MAYNESRFRVKRRNYLLIGIVLGVISFCGLFSTLFVYPYSVKTIIEWAMPIKPGSISRGMFLNLPFPLEFHCHIFNITNPNEVQNGEKPEIEDIGPFVFYEYIIKHDEVDDEDQDTLEYTLKKVWIYQPELSNGLTGEEQVTVLHPVISSLALTVNYNQRGFLQLISEVINEMFKKPTTPFWTGRAMDFLFNGIKIDCTSKKFQVKTICAIFASGDNPNVQPFDPNIPPNKQKYFVFSLLGAYNDSFSGRFKVMRGKRDVNEVGRVVSVDGKTKMRNWGSDEANEYLGTDGYFMPPFRSKKEPLWGFERMICVSLGLKYERQTFIRGFPMPTFVKNFTEFASNRAYCRKNVQLLNALLKKNPRNQPLKEDAPPRTKKKKTYCPIEGTIDLFNCLNVPIVASLPHFLDGHPSLLENVKSGLNPNRDDHELSATLDLETGVPFRGIKRLQLNFEVLPVKEVQVMKQLRPMIFPLAWIEERAELPGLYITAMHCLFFFRLGVKIVEYLCLTILPLAAMASISIHLMIENGTIEVIETPVSSVKIVGKSADSIEKGVDANNDSESASANSTKSKKSSKTTKSSNSSKRSESNKSGQNTPSTKSAKRSGSTEKKDNNKNDEPTENPEYAEVSRFEKWLNSNYEKWRGDGAKSSDNTKKDANDENNH